MLKLASNSFTTPERMSGWAAIIREYRKMGCYSPAIIESLSGRLAEMVIWEGRPCVAWEEEFAEGKPADAPDACLVREADGKYAYHDQALAFLAKVGQRHLNNFPWKSGWVRLEPFADHETADEVTQCVGRFDRMVRDRAPGLIPRWLKIRRLFADNKRALEKVYYALPTSVFQGDSMGSNLLLDEKGGFNGLIDYNLAGKDTVVNMFLSTVLYGYSYHVKVDADPDELFGLSQNRQNAILRNFLEALRYLGNFYTFSALEAKAAPLLYKYIVAVEYKVIQAFEACGQDVRKQAMVLDYMEHVLLQENMDFAEAMLGGGQA